MRAGFDYDRIEEGFYDLIFHRNKGVQSKWHHLAFEFIKRKMGTYRNHLDIGCGPGTFIALLDPHLPSLGLDISRHQTEYARSRYGSLQHEFRRIEPGPLPLEDNSFDVVTCLQLIEHLTEEEGESLLSEAYRVIRPGGRFIISMPNHRSLWPFLEALLNRFGRLSYEEQHITHWDRVKLANRLEEAGFVDVSVEAYQFTAPFWAALHWKLSDIALSSEPAWAVRRFGLLLFATGRKRPVGQAVPDAAPTPVAPTR